MFAPRISAAMIVRNEAAVLADCLKSIRDEVDEIVVTDTGSSDESRHIAGTFRARVLERPWDDDFSAARNHSLEAATGDYILYIDADERLDAPRRGMLRRTIERSPDTAAFLMRFQPRVGFTSYLEARLFRRDPRIRFTGRIHEQMWTGIDAVCAAEKLLVRRCAARIVHVGYEGDLTRKHHRNLPLLERAVRENPYRVYCWWHLGETLAAMGRRGEAEKALWNAIRIAKHSRKLAERFEASLAYQTLARIALEARQDPLPLIREGLRALPQDHALRFLQARALINAQEYEVALPVLRALMAQEAESFEDARLAYDKRIFGEFAQDLAGIALLRLGRFEEASAAFEKAAAAACDSSRLRYRAKAAAAKSKNQARSCGAV